MMTNELSFFVQGRPMTSGSKRGVTYRRRSGRIGVRILESCDGAGQWREDVAMTAKKQIRTPLSGPLALQVIFYLQRPASHYRAGGNELRPSAPEYPTTRPDATKLLRCLEDALTGILWEDDAQIVSQTVLKRYSGPHSSGAYVLLSRRVTGCFGFLTDPGGIGG